MKKTFLIVLLLFAIICADGKKISKSRTSSSSRGSSRKTYNPQPTSSAAAQPSHHQPAPKPSLFGWQEKPAQSRASAPRQSQQPKQTQTHSYPSSNTGLSGNQAKQPSYPQNVQKSSVPQSASGQSHSYPSSNTGLSGTGGSQAKQPSYHQENVQRSSVPQSASGQQTPTRTQQSHSYPGSSNGLSGTGGYPQQGGHSGAGAAPPPYSPGGNNYGGNYGGNYHHPAPPPPYSPNYGGHGGYGAPGGYGGYGGHGGYGGYGGSYSPQMPGYFGNYGNKGYGGVSRGSNILTGVGIAGAGVGTILTGLALWNLARSTGRSHHTVIYDNSGQPVAVAPNNSTEPVVDPILGDLVNCTLTISNNNATEILGIPCAIATSFTPEADVKDAGIGNNPNDNTKCTVTVVTKAGKEFSTTIPCSTLLNTAAENNVTEPPLINNGSEPITGPMVPPAEQYANVPVSPTALPLAVNGEIKNLNCTPEHGEVRDPINPCFVAANNLTVIPLASSDPVTSPTTAPSA